MSIDSRKDDILVLIKKNGPMGVNSIARELNLPLSSLQKYLHRQSYFKINEEKKWDLPENVIGDIKTNTLELMVNVIENSIRVLKGQMEELTLSVDNALTPISTLKRGIRAIEPSVAGNNSGQTKIDPRLIELNETNTTLFTIFRKQKDNIPDDLKDLIFNFDYVGLILKEGKTYTDTFLEGDIYNLLSGRDTELSEDTIEILKENQKQD